MIKLLDLSCPRIAPEIAEEMEHNLRASAMFKGPVDGTMSLPNGFTVATLYRVCASVKFNKYYLKPDQVQHSDQELMPVGMYNFASRYRTQLCAFFAPNDLTGLH